MRLAETVTFGGSNLDRAAHLRDDADQLAALRLRGKTLPLWRGKPLLAEDARLGWVDCDHQVLRDTASAVFLGIDDGEIPRFAQDISDWQPQGEVSAPAFLDTSRQSHPDLPMGQGFEDLRGVMALLTPREAELAATAKAILQWHSSHGYCAKCGAVSLISHAGWQRDCPNCHTSHFPRTDPVVIMLVVRGNNLLLGRNAVWPEGMYSLLAGFVEPGETLEAAVRREVFEETRIRTSDVRYLASQPWPFPASLMIGCIAEATSDAITIDPNELEEALWISREDMMEVFAGRHPTIKAGRKGAIASFLIGKWLADQLE